MIRFQCPDCSTGLRVADANAGKRTRCPQCGRTVRVPAAEPNEVDELPVVEDDEEEFEEVEAADEEDERPRKRRRRRPRPADEEEEGPREFVTRDRIMGAVGVLFGVAFLIGAAIVWLSGTADPRNFLTTAANFGDCLGLTFGVLLLVVGAFYAIRG